MGVIVLRKPFYPNMTFDEYIDFRKHGFLRWEILDNIKIFTASYIVLVFLAIIKFGEYYMRYEINMISNAIIGLTFIYFIFVVLLSLASVFTDRIFFDIELIFYRKILNDQTSRKIFVTKTLESFNNVYPILKTFFYVFLGLLLVFLLDSFTNPDKASISNRVLTLVTSNPKEYISLFVLILFCIFNLIVFFEDLVKSKKLGADKKINLKLLYCRQIGFFGDTIYIFLIIFLLIPGMIFIGGSTLNWEIENYNSEIFTFYEKYKDKLDVPGGTTLESLLYKQLDVTKYLNIYYYSFLPICFLVYLSFFFYGFLIPTLYIRGGRYTVLLLVSFLSSMFITKVGLFMYPLFNLRNDILISAVITFMVYLVIKHIDSLFKKMEFVE